MRDMEALRASLAGMLATDAHPRPVEVLECRPLTGGYSRIMTKATVRWDGGSDDETLILRSDPVGDEIIYMTDRFTEWKLLERLTSAATVPMPPALYYDDGSRLGTPTIILGCCPGPSLQAISLEEGTDLAGYALQVADSLAAIHTTPATHLDGVLTAPPSWEDYVLDLSSEWARAEKDHVESVPVLRYLSGWLAAHLPVPMHLGLVHGDFQASNLMIGDGLQVIDWEFSHIGDPREDLGWFNLYSASSGAPNLYALDPEAFLERYRQGTGASEKAVNQTTVLYFSVIAATRVYLDILRSSAAMAEGRSGGTMLAYNLNALAVGNNNWLATCLALEGAL